MNDKDISSFASLTVIIIAVGVWAICTKSLIAIVILFAVALILSILMFVLLLLDE